MDILRGRNQLPTLLEDIRKCKGADSKVDSYISSLESSLQTVLLAQGQGAGAESQAHARNIADRLAIAMQASALLRFGDAKVVCLVLFFGWCCNRSCRHTGGRMLYCIESERHWEWS